MRIPAHRDRSSTPVRPLLPMLLLRYHTQGMCTIRYLQRDSQSLRLLALSEEPTNPAFQDCIINTSKSSVATADQERRTMINANISHPYFCMPNSLRKCNLVCENVLSTSIDSHNCFTPSITNLHKLGSAQSSALV